MDPVVPLIAAAVLAAAALVAPSPRLRAWAMPGALAVTPVILVFHIADTEQFEEIVDVLRPVLEEASRRIGHSSPARGSERSARRSP